MSFFFFFSSRRRHTRCSRDWSSDVCSSDLADPKDKAKIVKLAGQQVDGFGQLAADGSTMCGNWLHSGVYTEAGNNAQRRNNADPTGLGMFHNWAFSWPANRRIKIGRAHV